MITWERYGPVQIVEVICKKVGMDRLIATFALIAVVVWMLKNKFSTLEICAQIVIRSWKMLENVQIVGMT